MSDQEKTHYRKAFKSPYLSAADITEQTVLTIARVVLEIDKTKQTKDFRNTAYFVEKEIRSGEELKPMILNVGNSEVVRDQCGSKFIEDWSRVFTVWVKQGVKFGRDTVEGLRLTAGSVWVDQQQAAFLEALAKEVKADIPGLLKWAGCDTFSKFPVAKFNSGSAMLEKKRK